MDLTDLSLAVTVVSHVHATNCTVFLSPSPVTYPDEEGEVGPVQLCTLEL